VAAFPRHPALEGFTGFLLRKVSAASFERFSAMAAEHDLHPMHFGLLMVLEADGPISQQDLAERTGVDPSSMVGRMDRLVELGLVDRERSSGDRRSYEISLNAAGRRVLKTLRTDAKRSGDAMFAPLNQSERQQLHRLLAKMADHVDAQAAEGEDAG
jgi:DNA-binding MarR family transcriptional regulator